MIAVKIEGRLGNQLFQYAFIYASAKKLRTKFYIDKSVDHLLLDRYFLIEKDLCWIFDKHLFSIKGYKNFFSHYLRYGFYYLLKKALFLKEEKFSNLEPPSLQINKIKYNRIYSGYFQSERYFINHKTEILKIFSIKDIYKDRFELIFRSLPKAEKYITIHIRRGDYLTENLALDTAYYHNAINTVKQPGNYYIFISDDPGFVKNEFNYLQNKYVSENDEITDLQFLINADICILSNSSFSWWGAWLNTKADKTVYAQKNWLGFDTNKEYPLGISDNLSIHWIN
jgi:hypothetical protein